MKNIMFGILIAVISLVSFLASGYIFGGGLDEAITISVAEHEKENINSSLHEITSHKLTQEERMINDILTRLEYAEIHITADEAGLTSADITIKMRGLPCLSFDSANVSDIFGLLDKELE